MQTLDDHFAFTRFWAYIRIFLTQRKGNKDKILAMFEAILFDFYDVIHVDPFNKWLADNGLKREGEIHEVNKAYDRGQISMQDFLDKLAELTSSNSQDIKDSFIASRKYDEDILKLIDDLSDRYSLGLISNAGGPGLRRLLDTRDLQPKFNEIIISGEVGYIKPEKEIFDLALERLQVKPKHSIFIDDNPYNVEAANSYGLSGILFTGYKSLMKDLEALKIID